MPTVPVNTASGLRRDTLRRAATALETLREIYPENPVFRELDVESRLVVSEPLGDLPGAWNEVPESSYGVVQPGNDELHPFAPVAPDVVNV